VPFLSVRLAASAARPDESPLSTPALMAFDLFPLFSALYKGPE
jgi:hypothetical protein